LTTGSYFDFSNESSSTGTDPSNLPPPPTNVQLGQSSTDGSAVILSWTLPTSSLTLDNSTIVGVIIYQNLSTYANEWVRVTYIGSRYTSTTITNLNPSKAYHFCISCVNQYGEGQKSTPTPYLPGGRGADTEAETPKEVLTGFQIFGIVIGGITVIGAIILFAYIFFYRTKHKDEINTYQYMSDTTPTTGTTAWTAGRSPDPNNDRRGTMALDDGTTMVATGGPVYGFEDKPSGKKKKSKKEGERGSDSDEDVEGVKKKKKKSKKKSKSKKKNG